MNIYDFSDKIQSEKSLRMAFVDIYVDKLLSSTSTEDIVADWRRIMKQEVYSRIADGEADTVLEQVNTDYPGWLRQYFGIDA